jgi:Na+/citrate or Na+/malate symporter
MGMIVDISHTSYRTQLDVLNITKAPVIFSHSNMFSLFNHSRNVKDDVLLELVCFLLKMQYIHLFINLLISGSVLFTKRKRIMA